MTIPDDRGISAGSPTSSSGRVLHFILNLVGSVLILGLGVFGLIFFGAKPDVPTDVSKSGQQAAIPLVDVSTVSRWTEPFQVSVDGEASTWRTLTVGAEVAGRVLKKAEICRSGSFVNQGDVLFEIDPLNYQLDEQRLTARLNQAEEELRALEVDMQNVTALLTIAQEDNALQKQHLQRVQSLFDRKATSEVELDTATRQELTSRNALQLQQNQLNSLLQSRRTKEAARRLAEVELQRTRLDLKRCLVTAPITGRIVDDAREEGDYIKPGDPLVRLSDSGRMEVRCSLKGEELAWIWQQSRRELAQPVPTSEQQSQPEPGSSERKSDPLQIPAVPCEVAFEFEGVETVWEGVLSRYEGTGMDRATRMFPCRVVVNEPERPRAAAGRTPASVTPPTLLSGMYVTVRIPIDAPVPLFRIPAEAIRPGQQVWLIRDGRLRVVPVSLVQMQQDFALVHPLEIPLVDGDQAVVSPLASIQDGMPVTQREATADTVLNTPEKTAPAKELSRESSR